MLGAALARRAARELEDGAGIPSTSVAALLDALDRHPLGRCGRRAVLVLDEAGDDPHARARRSSSSTRARRDAKLVLLGDHRQLPAIGAGGAFRGLLARLPVIELQENRRQLAEWERDALQALRARRRARRPSSATTDADRIVVGERRRRRCAARWSPTGGRRATRPAR